MRRSSAGAAFEPLEPICSTVGRSQISLVRTRGRSKFAGAIEMSYSGLDTFFGGLEGVVGAPDPHLFEAMEAEHTKTHDASQEFTTGCVQAPQRPSYARLSASRQAANRAVRCAATMASRRRLQSSGRSWSARTPCPRASRAGPSRRKRSCPIATGAGARRHCLRWRRRPSRSMCSSRRRTSRSSCARRSSPPTCTPARFAAALRPRLGHP